MGNQKQQNFVAIGYFWLIQQTLSYSLLRLFVTEIDILARLFFAPLLAAPGFNHSLCRRGREEGGREGGGVASPPKCLRLEPLCSRLNLIVTICQYTQRQSALVSSVHCLFVSTIQLSTLHADH